jgi:hypothetical protein
MEKEKCMATLNGNTLNETELIEELVKQYTITKDCGTNLDDDEKKNTFKKFIEAKTEFIYVCPNTFCVQKK